MIHPPADVAEIQRGNWLTLPNDDPVVIYLAEKHWDRSEQPISWEVARLSQAAYIYREKSTGWAVVVKFYVVKTGSEATDYARREMECNQQALEAGLETGEARAVRPLALWRGGLFLEYVDGLTLESVIAVRSSRPGTLTPSLEYTAKVLAKLHTQGHRPDALPDFKAAIRYAHKVADQLAKYGVLKDDPMTQEGLAHLIDRWAERPEMEDFRPTITHGDATTTNFVFPNAGSVVAIDWERLEVADPASDLGRLMAEVGHSINQHGGTMIEAESFVQHLADTYSQALPPDEGPEALVKRARFYRASSTLRIARNGWVSRLDRTALVAQAMALLASL